MEKDCWITIILNQKPTRFARDALNCFSEEFETHFGGRIRNLYSKFQGDISIFKEKSITNKSLDEIIESIFHLGLKLPYKIGSTKNKEIPEKYKKLFNLTKHLSRKNKKRFYLEEVFNNAKERLDSNNEEIINSILNLVDLKLLIPISTKLLEEQQL